MSLQHNDLRDLVGKKIHIDEYSSKMGDDADVIVVSLKVKYYDPAYELSNFIEKGYDWALDADVSAGEMEDGGYLVFIESLRRPSFPKNLTKLLNDLRGPTGNDPALYEFAYHKDKDYTLFSEDAIKEKVPLSPREYKKLAGLETDDVPEEEPITKTPEDIALESMQMAAGLTPKSRPVTDPALKHFVNLSKR